MFWASNTLFLETWPEIDKLCISYYGVVCHVRKMKRVQKKLIQNVKYFCYT